MWPVFPAERTLIVIGVALLLALFAMRIVQPAWWSSRAARALLLVAFGGALTGVGIWSVGHALDRVAMVYWGAGMAYVGALVLLPAAVVMPFAAGVDRLLVRLTRKRARELVTVPATAEALAKEADEDASTPPSKNASLWRRKVSATRVTVSRRALIRFGTASLPAMAAMGGASGFAQAKRDPTMPIIRLRYPGLHPDLEGLKILQLSDLHLGACLGLEDLKRGLTVSRRAHRPDLILLTGDLADDPMLIPDALRLVAEENARYGALASLGNHEYLHDIAVTRPKYEASPIPLLVGTGRSIRVGRATLFIGGADDPVHMAGDIAGLLTPSIEAAASMAPAHADFRLLLCHRPEGFGPANTNGFDLTLSGHTHGGQIGMFGRSILEKIKPGIGWWGTYSKKRPTEIATGERRSTRGCGGPSRLYTTSGFGHWFPFRVGCPTEMPLIVLTGGRNDPERRSEV